MPKEVTVNVSILPEVAPYVDMTLDALEGGISALEQLSPHLDGAFSSLKNGWPHMTDDQKIALLNGCPKLKRAIQLRNRLEPLINSMPNLELPNG
jgi:hypothetical protein